MPAPFVWLAHRGGSLNGRARWGAFPFVTPPDASQSTPSQLIDASVSCCLTAINVQDLSRDEGCPFEIEDPVDDVTDLAEPAERV